MNRRVLTATKIFAVSVLFLFGVTTLQGSSQSVASSLDTSQLKEFSGMIARVDETTKDIVVDFHIKRMTFSIEKGTSIVKKGGKCIEEMSFADLKTYSPFDWHWASVQYKKAGYKWAAEGIEVSRLW